MMKRYGYVVLGPDETPFDDTPATITEVATPVELERLMVEDGKTLSEHRCPHCGTRMVPVRSTLLSVPPGWEQSVYCGNKLCSGPEQAIYVPSPTGRLIARTSQELQLDIEAVAAMKRRTKGGRS